MSYLTYKLISMKELDAIAQEDPERMKAYFNRVYRYLSRMKVGVWVKVDDVAAAGTVEVFIKVVCRYIISCYRSRAALQVEFSDDYTEFRKI